MGRHARARQRCVERRPERLILDIGLADWNRLFAVQVTGAYLMSRAFFSR